MITVTPHELVLELDEWRVTLLDGTSIRLWAHSYGEDDDQTVFQALMRGTPNYLVPIASFPTQAIATIRSN